MSGERSLGWLLRIGLIVLALAGWTWGQQTRPASATTRPVPLKLPAIGDRLEVKWGHLWFGAIVKNKSPKGWILVEYDREKTFEWVEPWRVRKTGSASDLEYASPNPSKVKPEPPPTDPPSLEAPEKNRATRADAKAPATAAPATAAAVDA